MFGPSSSEILTSGKKRKTDSGKRFWGILCQMLLISMYMHMQHPDAEYLQSTFPICLDLQTFLRFACWVLILFLQTEKHHDEMGREAA